MVYVLSSFICQTKVFSPLMSVSQLNLWISRTSDLKGKSSEMKHVFDIMILFHNFLIYLVFFFWIDQVYYLILWMQELHKKRLQITEKPKHKRKLKGTCLSCTSSYLSMQLTNQTFKFLRNNWEKYQSKHNNNNNNIAFFPKQKYQSKRWL